VISNSLRGTALSTLAVFVVVASQVSAAERPFAAPEPDEVLRTLRPTHPRLILDADALRRVKELIRTDEMAGRLFERVKSDAENILTQPPSKYKIPDGKRLLSVSRRVKERIRTMGLVYMIERDTRYRDRIWDELEAAAGFKDWNPSHFLDTAEMTHAFGIAYDWLYDQWTEKQRRVIREAIETYGLRPAMKVYRSGKGWPKNVNNWNQVCNGGIGIGALAIADEKPDLAAEILSEAIHSLPRAMRHYAPDGGGTEGVTYWDYGSRYNILFLSALETALGTDFGLSGVEGFELSGTYQMYMSGADRLSFNFADCSLRRMGTAQHFWMGRKFNRPEFSWFRHTALRDSADRGGALDLMWYDTAGRDFDATSLPLDKYFRGAESVSMRSSWNDPNALVLGIQAGDTSNLGGHRHLDLGTFILEAQGQRWAIDSGVEHETYMRHIHGNPKWAYYRVRAEGHNTLVINPDDGPDQNPKAIATIIDFESTPDGATAVVDLTDAYDGRARHVVRTFSMIDRARVTVTDEVKAGKPADLWWFMHTEAEVDIDADGKRAVLRKGGKEFSARIVEPREARFSVMKAKPMAGSPDPKPQEDNRGRRKLVIHLAEVTDLKLSVSLGGS